MSTSKATQPPQSRSLRARSHAQPRPRRGVRRSPNWLHVILIPVAVLWMVPVFMVVGLSLLPSDQPGTRWFGMFPEHPSLSNYQNIWAQNPIARHFLNSLLITVPSVIIVALFGAMAAFALVRLRIPLRALIFATLLLGLILPVASIVVASYQILQSIGLYNNLLGLVLIYSALGLPFAVVIIRTSYQAVPLETYEAAITDGANKWQVFWRIYFPMGRPALAVVVVWQTMMTWNDFLLPLVTLESNELKPLTLVPLAYRGTYLSQPGSLFAILVLISVPIVVVFLSVQRMLVNGLAGAIK